MKDKLIVIVGPTAVGKTDLSIAIANEFEAEIISGDSMQIYRGMDIGTGKVTQNEMADIPHYLIDILNPDEEYSVADFQKDVNTHIHRIQGNNRIPIIVGGTGLYINAVLYDYNFTEARRDDSITRRLEERLEQEGNLVLYNELKEIDPVQAKKIHPNNYRRVIRALEVYEVTGKTMSEMHEAQEKTPKYDHILIGLEMDRDLLYKQINGRVDRMIADGLVEEVRSLYEQGYGESKAMQAIGYKELIPFIKGQASLADCVDLLKQNSRRYAKRQLTWFKNKMDVTWYPITPESFPSDCRQIIEDLKLKLI